MFLKTHHPNSEIIQRNCLVFLSVSERSLGQAWTEEALEMIVTVSALFLKRTVSLEAR